MGMDWYYSEELSPSDVLVDKFADSKFNIDKWSSFAREIIQNSLDAQDDVDKPVVVDFDLNKDLRLEDIPGGKRTKEILERCQNVARNPQTKSAYKRGLEILNREKVYCLKISDRNTKGVETGRDAAWGALVYDEGKSVKQRAGAAGSHGVGKKVPFIISACRNVFYATKNKYFVNGVLHSDCLAQGKSILINWVDELGTRRNLTGWYGDVDKSRPIKEIVQPLSNDAIKEKHPYFVRNDEYGTDVIIVGVNAYSDNKDNDEKIIKKKIINAVIESFFVAILENKLIVTVLGTTINKDNIVDLMDEYYEQPQSVKNDVRGCLRVYLDKKPENIEITARDGKVLGEVNVYFDLGNEYNKKYYTVIRSHGMKIVDYRVNNASQPYTAVVLINGKELNELLSSLENAAHDDFITNDSEVVPDKKAVYALREVEKKVKEYIVEQTKIDSMEGQKIAGLNNIITIPGMIASVKKKPNVPIVKKKKTPKPSKGTLGKGKEQGVVKHANGTRRGNELKASKNGNDDIIVYDDSKYTAFFMKTGKKYVLKLKTDISINNTNFMFMSVDADGNSDDSINDFITDLVCPDDKKIKVDNGIAKGINIIKDKEMRFAINLNNDVAYKIRVEITYRKGDVCE